LVQLSTPEAFRSALTV